MGYVTLHTICNPTQAAQAKLVFQTNRKLMTLLQSGTKINYKRFGETNVKQIGTRWLSYLLSEDIVFETKFYLAVLSGKISFWKWITCIFSIQNLKKMSLFNFEYLHFSIRVVMKFQKNLREGQPHQNCYFMAFLRVSKLEF